MTKRGIVFCLAIFLLGIFALETTLADLDARKIVIELLASAGLSDELNAGVKISADDTAVLCIADEGNFFMQYIIAEPNVSAEPNIVVESNVRIPFSCNKAVIVTHGFFDKAESDWPDDLANQIRHKTDPNRWICGFFDWRGGAAVINPVNAAKYGRDVAGPRLAKALLKLEPDLDHVHLIGHSAGCWTINSAARIIARQTDAQIHLTFLDAYVPAFWDQAEFGRIEGKNVIWAEHYYTKDITLGYTQKDLSAAHNVDITGIDPLIKEHKFPYRWYYATVAGRFRDCDSEAGDTVLTEYKGLDYGFARSAEAGRQNWEETLTLKKGNKAVKLKRPGKKKLLDLKIFKQNQRQKNE
jgi:hypothetical protein